MSIKVTNKDIIWNYIGIIMSMFSNLLLLPFMVYFIDGDLLGLWYVYLSIGGIVTLFDFGFNPTFARNVAYCWSGAESLNPEGVNFVYESKPNYILLKKVIDTCKLIYFIIAFIALFIMATAGTIYIFFIASNIFNVSVVISWIIYILAVYLNIYYGYYATFLRGVGAVSLYNKINVLARIIQIIISIGLMFLGYQIIAVSLAYLFYGFLLRFFSKKAFYSYNDIGFYLKNINKTTIKEIFILFKTVWHNAWKDGIVALSNYSANQASTLIASFFLSLSETGIYSISVQLITAIATISAGLYTAYQPAMQSAYINNNKNELKKLMAISITAFDLIFIFGVIFLLMIGIPILRIIKPTSTFNNYVIIGLAVYNFFYKRQSYYTSFISNTNCVPYMKPYIISSLLGIFLSILFIRFFHLGIWGLIIGQFLPQIIYNCWKWTYDVHKMLNTNIYQMFVIGVNGFFNLIINMGRKL